jgi:serine/threonine-protein kinase
MEGRPSIQGRSARYEPLFKLASGGMATVYVGRLQGAMGFQRLVAIKRPHRHLLDDPRFVGMLLHEANLASKLHHPNVVSVQDVVQNDDVVYLIMDLVEGVSLADLQRAAKDRDLAIPREVAIRLLLDASAGLHAAHELADDDGNPMGLVHRDVSPHNVLVGADGIARVVDFGIAKCANAQGSPTTTTGTLKGKYAYMAPEYIEGRGVDRRSDVFGLGVVAWELLAGRRLFVGDSPPSVMMKVVQEAAPPLSDATDAFGKVLDDVLRQALAKKPSERFDTVEAFANALEHSARAASSVASAAEVARLVRTLVGDALDARRQKVKALLEERNPSVDRERVTDPLPMHLAALDQAGSLPGISAREQERPSQAQSIVEPERSALLPETTSSQSRLPVRRYGAWPWVLLAVVVIAALVLVLARSRESDAGAASGEGSATVLPTGLIAGEPPTPIASALTAATALAASGSIDAGQPDAVATARATAAGTRKPVAANPEETKPAADPTVTTPADRSPPPNPYE